MAGNPNIKDHAAKGGRARKGVPNKFTRDIKEALLEAFNSPEIGGVQGLINWGKQPRNQAKFFEFTMKLLPNDHRVTGADGGEIVHKIVREVVKPPQE